MARLIPASKRVVQARALIQQARDLPLPSDAGWQDFSYVAQVKDLLRQARELIKFIPNSPSASEALKDEVAKLFRETETAEKEILRR
ncbi:MAG: hypothetical protein IT308_04640 [Anaerolineaceae bacterium]|nr:hypothetical protein [Anaerolineaceae bacterium]